MATTDEMAFTITTRREVRLGLDEVRLDRARRSGGPPPALKALVTEALAAFLDREDKIELEVKEARRVRRGTLRQHGLLATETWIHVTSRDKYFRILRDGRSLGLAHSEDGWKAATRGERDGDEPDVVTQTVESIRAVYGTDEPFAMYDGGTCLQHLPVAKHPGAARALQGDHQGDVRSPRRRGPPRR